jgi:hypothetical protein
MKSRIVEQMRRDNFENAQQQSNGNVRALTLFTSMRAAQSTITDMEKIPSVENNTLLQDESGNFFFTVGYSEVGGGHVIP